MAMKTARKLILAFNRGVVSALGLARIDLKRMGYSAETQTNWMPRVLGSMSLRVGFGKLDNTASNGITRLMPFVFSETDLAQVEVFDSAIYVRIDDARITRPSVSSAVTNGTFTTDLTGWTDIDVSPTSSIWISGDKLQLLGDGTEYAGQKQQVTTVETGVEHALKIVISQGPVTFKVGSTDLGEEYIAESDLGEGEHSLAFTPTGDFYITIRSRLVGHVVIDSVTVESSGAMSLTAPWADTALSKLRWEQSADVIYVAARGYTQRKIERRGTRSWSLVKYLPIDGPFRVINITPTTIATNNLTTTATLTASHGIFKSTHVGALFRIASIGQLVSKTIAAQNLFSDPIKVTGTLEARVFGIVITGLSTSTVTVQYSIGAVGAWIDLATTYAAAVSTSYDDGQDNQIIYYRIGIKTGD